MNNEKELKSKILELEAELKSVKKQKIYGLVWEGKKEDIVEDCKTNVPILKLKKKKGIVPKLITNETKNENILIEGDNYHALTVLNYTHQGKFDAIYADPPYNTGATDWKYNNDYVDKNDSFRHSKWISFMEKRLRVAKDLLKDDGVICVTIDDYELPRLLMLMEGIFGESNHLGTVPIRNNPAGRSTTKGISITHEYALFFGKTDKSRVGRLERNQRQIDRYDQEDERGKFEWVNFRKPGSMRIESPKMFFPIFATADNLRLPKVEWDDDNQEYKILEKPKRGEQIIYPIDDDGKERRWRWGIDRFIAEPSEFKVKVNRGTLHVYVKGRINNEGILPMTWWDKKEYSSTAYGTNLLKDIFAELQMFSYPKSLYAVMDCISVMTEKSDALVLDFFAGSGTTGHAVLELNKLDDGNRNFIVCTNNENNICEEVTYERLRRVISGYKNRRNVQVEGLGGNLRYYQSVLVDVERVQNAPDSAKIKLAYEAGEMIGLKENTLNEIEKNEWWQIFEGKEKNTAIYFKESKEKLSELVQRLESDPKPSALYIFSWGKNEYKSEYESNHVRIEDIPEPILEVYKEINKL